MFSKDEILKEIRRTAKDNDGKPLGVALFESSTGIKPYDWHKYWARFGDAQREAGFSGNKMKIAYDESYLFEKFISLMRELKKWPTKGEIFIKHINNQDFPSDKTFYARGLKQELVTKVQKYAENKKYKDIVKICKGVLEGFVNTDEEDEGSSSTVIIGSVYLAKSGHHYKIGRTSDVGRRHHEISIELPESYQVIHEIKTDDPSGVEAYWHRRFAGKRKNGEWFDLSSSEVKAFRRWRKIV